jgi:hypothetical protein
MNLSFSNLKKQFSGGGSIGKGFADAPHRYWGYALLFLLILSMLSVGLDGYVFWNYVMRLDTESIEPQVNIESLNRANFDKVKNTITEKETTFKEATQKTLPRDIFIPAPLGTSQATSTTN